MTRDAEMSATDFVTLVLSAVGHETDAFGVSRIPGYAAQAVNSYSAPGNRAALKETWEQGLRKLLENAEPGSDHQLSFVRAYAGAAHSEQALADLEGLLDGSLTYEGLQVDTDLRWTLLTGLVRAGRADAARIDAELERDNTISGQEHAAAARAARPTAEAKAEAWEVAMVRDDIPNETQRSVVTAFQCHGQDDVLAPYVEKYLVAADTMWEEKGTQRASTALESMFPRPLASQQLLDRVDAWLESSPANPAAKRYVREGRADVARALAAQAKDAAVAPTRRATTHESAGPSSADDGPALSPAFEGRPGAAQRLGCGGSAGPGRGRRASRCRAGDRRRGHPRRRRTASAAAVSSTSLSESVRRTAPPVTISRARAVGSTMIMMLREGATSELCSRVAKARGSPSAMPTKSENSKRLSVSALRIASSSANRSALLKSPAATCATGLGLVGVGAGQLRGALARAAEPVVLDRRGPRGQPLTADHRREVDQNGDHDEQQHRDADEHEQGVQAVDVVRRCPPLGHVGLGGARQREERHGCDENGGGPADDGLERGGHGSKDIGSPGAPLAAPGVD